MKRKIYDRLVQWKNESNGRTALLIEGARRVGKSYIVEEFAKNEYDSYVIINFSNTLPAIKKLFKDGTYDIPLLLQKLSIFTRTKFIDRRTLIVFDEVQKCPQAREAIKFLVEDGRYDYIETGSLISIHENIKDIIIPSEEEKLHMYPMDFEEFCWALGDEVTVPAIRSHFESMKPLGDDVHNMILDLFRRYILIGGMPKVVDTYAKTKDFNLAEKEKRMIIDLYREDIGKRAKTNKRKTSALYESIPSELSRHDKTFQLSDIDKNGKYANYEEPIYWLEDSMVVNLSFNCTEPSIALGLNEELSSMKMYSGDTGLLISLSINGNDEIMHDTYIDILEDRLHINEGMFMENVVAQILRSNGHKLYFHTFYTSDDEGINKKNRMEIDFLISNGKKILPIEVKSSNNKSHKSFDYFIQKHSKNLGQPYILHTKDLKKDGNILFLPVYMAICL